MSRSCHRATFSSAAWHWPRTRRARPQMCSESTGLRLWGIELEPFCPSANGSSASRISVRCSARISSATFSSDAATIARVVQNSAWRSRWTICVRDRRRLEPEDGGTPPPRRRARRGRRSPPRRRACPPDRLAGAPQPLEVAARLGVPERGLEPEVMGSAWTPWVRPTQRCRGGAAPSARPRRGSAPGPASRRSRAAGAAAPARCPHTSEEVRPMWTKRESAPSAPPGS